jgi:NADH-quinone oxidoreductase subunit E
MEEVKPDLKHELHDLSAIRRDLQKLISTSEYPREQVVNVMYALQGHYGYFNDEAVQEAAALLDMSPLEIEELATFYDFIYREPVGKFVIHVCDGVVCWMFHEGSVFDYLCKKLGVCAGQVTEDGMFTVLPGPMRPGPGHADQRGRLRPPDA